jgi:hypothetical protein
VAPFSRHEWQGGAFSLRLQSAPGGSEMVGGYTLGHGVWKDRCIMKNLVLLRHGQTGTPVANQTKAK